MTEPDEKPTFFMPKTTAFFTGASLLLALVFLAILVVAAVLLLEFHVLWDGSPAD
jgi:hypothetical protein